MSVVTEISIFSVGFKNGRDAEEFVRIMERDSKDGMFIYRNHVFKFPPIPTTHQIVAEIHPLEPARGEYIVEVEFLMSPKTDDSLGMLKRE